MLVKVTLSSTQDITFVDSKSDAYGIPGFCGDLSYTFSSVLPSFLVLSHTGSTTILTLATDDPADVSTTPIHLIVSLKDYSTVPVRTKDFSVQVICEVFNLSFDSSLPTQENIRIGVDEQPFLIPFATIKSPDCTQQPTFSLSMSPSAAFASLATTGNSGSLVLDGMTYLDAGSFTASVTG